MLGKWLIWDQAALASRVGLENWLDPIRYHAAKIPFRIEMCPLASDSIAAVLAAMKGKSARALVLVLGRVDGAEEGRQGFLKTNLNRLYNIYSSIII